MNGARRIGLAALVLASLLLAGCTFVEIANLSELEAHVLVTLPDSAGASTRIIRPGGTTSLYASYGGRYTITAIPSEDYRQLLIDVQAQVAQRIFEERASLTGEEITSLIQRIAEIERLLEDLKDETASCSGSVPDFETVVVTLDYLSENKRWSLNCP